jgi:hypothetical protein
VKQLLLSAIKCAWVNHVRQTKTHTAKEFVLQPVSFEVEAATEKLKMYKIRG